MVHIMYCLLCWTFKWDATGSPNLCCLCIKPSKNFLLILMPLFNRRRTPTFCKSMTIKLRLVLNMLWWRQEINDTCTNTMICMWKMVIFILEIRAEIDSMNTFRRTFIILQDSKSHDKLACGCIFLEFCIPIYSFDLSKYCGEIM